MNTKILKEIGLTKTEIKIYLALLKIGQTTTTKIIKESRINPSKVYGALDKLVQKDLACYVIKSNKKFFTASPPESLKRIIKQKQEYLKTQEMGVDEIIPELNNLIKEGNDVIHAEIHEGFAGLKSVYEKILLTLKKGETHYILGVPKIANDQLEGYTLDWHKNRIKKGIHCKYIYDSNAKEYGELRKKMQNTEVRYLPNNIVSPMWIEIFSDYVMIAHIKEYNSILFLIKDKEIARGYLDYFHLIWKQSTK